MPNFTRQTTVSTIVSNLMTELGLTPPEDLFSSDDPTVVQLLVMLTQVGQDLCSMHDWQMLHKEWELVCTSALEYPLPDDWNGFVQGASWDNTNRWPAVGSIPPAVWRLLKARLSNGEPAMITYKLQGNELVLFSAQDGHTIVLDYYSRGWILDADGTTYKDNATANDDTVLLDSRLVQLLLKLRWRASKGFDTTSEVDQFNGFWDTITGRDSPAPTLSIGANPSDGLLGYQNIPDTNYGL
jgi:hypothetical protein